MSHGDADERTVRRYCHQNEERSGEEVSGTFQDHWRAGHQVIDLREYVIG